MKTKNPYEILGLKNDATEVQIKKAYRNLAGSNHPDVGGDPKVFIEIKKAYDVLKDPSKKSALDKSLNRTNSDFYSKFYENEKNKKNVNKKQHSHFESYNKEKKINLLNYFILFIFIISLSVFLLSPLGTDVNGNKVNIIKMILSSEKEEENILKNGLSYSEVKKIYGEPDESNDKIWVYGESKILFDENGFVYKWENNGELK